MKENTKNKFSRLRSMAEEHLESGGGTEASAGDELYELMHELEVHQKELEIQNEELRRAHDELSQLHREYSELYEFAPCGYVTLSPNKTITRINLNGAVLLGTERGRAEYYGLGSFVSGESLSDYYSALSTAAETGEKTSTELALLRHDSGSVVPVRADVQADFSDSGELRQWCLTLIDISEARKHQRRLEQALKERDTLMKELNHRVSNNLMMITTLINLKNSQLGDEVDLSDINSQIDAIRIVHELMYKRDQVGSIAVQKYLGELLRNVFPYLSGMRVDVRNEVEDIELPSKEAITVGLIVNELATNAVKHGFRRDEEAVFTVRMRKPASEGRYELTVSNTGNPFPEDVDLESSDSLGLRLISSLASQMDGSIKLEKNPHPVFTLSFPVP